MNTKLMPTQSSLLRIRLDRDKPRAPLLDRRLVQDAESALEGMDESFLEWVGGQISHIRTAAKAIEAQPGDCGREVAAMNGLAHEIAQLGATLQYPLLTKICQSLNTLLAGRSKLDPRSVEAVGAHVDALAYVHLKKLKGEGDASAQHLLDNLAHAIPKLQAAES